MNPLERFARARARHVRDAYRRLQAARRRAIFRWNVRRYARGQPVNAAHDPQVATRHGDALRAMVRRCAGLPLALPDVPALDDSLKEFQCLLDYRELLRPLFATFAGKRVLFVGQAYYNGWYLSRELRRHGWVAELLNWDANPGSQIHYHGEDYRFSGHTLEHLPQHLAFFLRATYNYDVFHFSNAHGMCFGPLLQYIVSRDFAPHREIYLLKDLGKKIVYTNNGCLDGVSQTSFAAWGEVPVCSICRWRNDPDVCSDARNLEWGKFRNAVADFQCLLGGNRADYNVAPTVHEVPEFFCLDSQVWRPDLDVPEQFILPPLPPGGVRLYHGVGDRASRTNDEGVNIKCSHIYLPLIERLRREGHHLALMEPTDVPNRDVRYLQVQADIFLDMLTYGWFGANAREAMMLGKTVIAYIRPEWLDSVRGEIPEYADELPIVHATPETIESVLIDLIEHPDKRREIGRRSREFAVKWHSSEAAGRRFDEIYGRLLAGDPQLLDMVAR